MSNANVSIRLGLEGSKEVDRAFKDIGRTGRKELQELRKAANDLSPGLVAVSRTVGIAKDSIDDLVQSSGNFGRVATSFGPWGTAAAVAFTAIGAAAAFTFSKAKEAAQFADDLDDTATKIGTTTDALQEYQFAIVDAGGSAEDAITALDGFNVAIGKARAGFGRGSLKPFAALGFTKEELQQVKVGSDLIPEIAERISKLGSFAEQAAVADRLGLKPLLPLLLQGRDGMEALKNKAHELGAVMDADIVKTGAESNKQLELTARVIKAQLMTAFVDAAPAIVAVANAIALVAHNLNLANGAGVEGITRRIDDLKSLNKSMQDDAKGPQNPVAAWLRRDDPARIAANNAEIARLEAQRQRMLEAAKQAAPTGNASLIDQSTVADPAAAAASAAAKAEAEAKRQAAEIARQRQEDTRLIVSLMGEEEKASYDLKQALADLEIARQRGNVAGDTPAAKDAELARLKAIVTAKHEEAKLARQQAAADKTMQEFGDISTGYSQAAAGIAGYRNAARSPETMRSQQIADLDAARQAAESTASPLTDGEYEDALKRINDEYKRMKIAIYDATLQGQLMNDVLNGQISSWGDLERFALQALRSIIMEAAKVTFGAGGGGGGFGGFISAIGQSIAGSLGFGGGVSMPSFSGLGAPGAAPGIGWAGSGYLPGGRATGGPVYGGDTRPVGERGIELLRTRSDGFVYDAATSAAAMRSAPSSSPAGTGGGAIGVTLNNHSGTPLRAQARETRDEKGNRQVEVTLQEQARGMIDARFTEMFEGKRDDQRLARSFGVRRQLSGA